MSPFVVGVALATAEDEIAMAGGGTKGVAFVRALRDVVDLAMAGDTESAREWLGAALRDFPGQP